MDTSKVLDDILHDIDESKKKEVPDTPEKYLLKRVIDLEEELELTKRAYVNMRDDYIRKLEIQKDRFEEKVVNFEMLQFMWDKVIGHYDDESNMLFVHADRIKVPGKLQDSFHLWQSFKDNPEGGGV